MQTKYRLRWKMNKYWWMSQFKLRVEIGRNGFSMKNILWQLLEKHSDIWSKREIKEIRKLWRGSKSCSKELRSLQEWNQKTSLNWCWNFNRVMTNHSAECVEMEPTTVVLSRLLISEYLWVRLKHLLLHHLLPRFRISDVWWLFWKRGDALLLPVSSALNIWHFTPWFNLGPRLFCTSTWVSQQISSFSTGICV